MVACSTDEMRMVPAGLARSALKEAKLASRRSSAGASPIPGTKNNDHLAENHGALKVNLTSEDLRQMAAEFAPLKVHGASMEAENMALVQR